MRLHSPLSKLTKRATNALVHISSMLKQCYINSGCFQDGKHGNKSRRTEVQGKQFSLLFYMEMFDGTFS
ncbi:hypothetical protein T12_15305 [Trichinella patagoniensis]|uniref:Uncharacterized protein n=1 Tax=Trichinella patagoniensis TaxID=990121 RepID=A0A0V0ZAD0_9BILA|nr:hypothetical protein T12_15305 [Trichinella patagoniensis]